MARLLLMTSDFLPQIGGVSLMMHHLANAFVARGIGTAVIAPMRDDHIDFKHQYQLMPDPAGSSQMVELSRRPREDQRLIRLLDDTVHDFQPDCMLLGHWHTYDAAALAMRAAHGIPLAAYFHGYDLRAPLEAHDSMIQRAAARVLRSPTRRQRVLRLVREADHLLTNSHYTADLVARAAPGRSAQATGCGLPASEWRREFEMTPRYDPRLKLERRRALKLNDRPMVAFLGRLVPGKNVQMLLHALARLPEAQGVIVGDGPEHDRLSQLASELGLDDRVTFTGRVLGEHRWAYLRAADVFCLPSQELPDGSVEGFGIVLLEAGAAGTPVVATRSGGMVDAVEHERTGLLVDPHDPAALVAALDRLIHDQTLAATCVQHAREMIRQRFNWNTVAETAIAHLDLADM